jgi:CelD/BcsL family acetyltransferase involved in cellulose biosynthesis
VAAPDRRADRVRIESIHDLEAARAEWASVAEASRNIFATWEWSAVWWRHFGHGRSLLTSFCRDEDGRMVAVLPLYVWSTRPLRVLRFLGHPIGCQLGPICGPDRRGDAARALLAALDDVRWDVFLGEGVSADEGWAGLLRASIWATTPNPVLRLDFSDWDDYLSSCSANFRQQLRRKERKLARDHAIRYRHAADPARLQQDLDTLFALHGERWIEERSAFGGGVAESFHREFASVALERGWLRLWFLEVDGVAVAAWYGFRFQGIETYYQLGRARAWEKSSVGLLIVAHSVREALADGIEEYRFGPGGGSYKYRFTEEDPGLQWITLPGSRAGRLALATGATLQNNRLVRKMLKKSFNV